MKPFCHCLMCPCALLPLFSIWTASISKKIKYVIIHPPLSITAFPGARGHHDCWSLSQLSLAKGTVTPWTSCPDCAIIVLWFYWCLLKSNSAETFCSAKPCEVLQSHVRFFHMTCFPYFSFLFSDQSRVFITSTRGSFWRRLSAQARHSGVRRRFVYGLAFHLTNYTVLPCDVVQDFRHHIYLVLIKHPLLVLTGP